MKNFCEWHQEEFVELWPGELLCESCFVEYHLDIEHTIQEEREKRKWHKR